MTYVLLVLSFQVLGIFAAYNESPCKDEIRSGQSGVCMETGCCDGGNYVSGYCPTQPNNVKCCFSRNTCSSSDQKACDDVSIVTRSQWGARGPKSQSSLQTPVGKILIHHTAGATCNSQSSCSRVVRNIQMYHMNTKKWSDIGYNFLIGGDGKVYEGRGWKTRGAHSPGYNSKSLGISFIGNYQEETPSSGMLQAAKTLAECGVSKGYITSSHTVHGHRDAKCTDCPGNKLYDVIKRWTNYGGRLPDYVC
ncbi:peptidoglycan-recognition protein SC2-like [Limulus polyphemus]|uniref:Peptidoglycan-recognition protein SC2-like n=1 Tax=Limulus polyphemus TaxID=6850 RepID=A0ABM1C0T5_LIMPO|nr:peptidoglycan-recognition protein SC2-like [Limulus polyphemus]